MTFEEYQQLARRTQRKELHMFEMREHALYGLASEVGEVMGLHQKVHQGHPMDETALRLEIGDVLWFVAELCDVYGWGLDDIAIANIAKLRNRYPVKFTVEQSIHREEKKKPVEQPKPKPLPGVSKSRYYTSVKEVKGNA